jgi:chromosome segregation ATPase
MTRSILELDEARRRLEQVVSDQKQIAELIAKLKLTRDALTKSLGAAEARLNEIEATADRLQETSQVAADEIEGFRATREQLVADVRRVQTKAESEVAAFLRSARAEQTSLVKELAYATSTAASNVQSPKRGHEQALADLERKRARFEDELRATWTAWNADQRRVAEDFINRHEAGLRAVKDAYDSARGSLESFVPMYRTLDEKVDRMKAAQVEALAELRRNHDDFRTDCRLGFERLADAQKNAAASLTNVQQTIAQQQTTLRNLGRRVAYGRLLLWVVCLSILASVAFHTRGDQIVAWVRQITAMTARNGIST